MRRLSTAALFALLLLALSGCVDMYTIDVNKPLTRLANSQNAKVFTTYFSGCWRYDGVELYHLDLYRDRGQEWWMRCPNQYLVHLGPGPEMDERFFPGNKPTPEIQTLMAGMRKVEMKPCGKNLLCVDDPETGAKLSVGRSNYAVDVQGIDYSASYRLYKAIMDGADPGTLTPQRRLAPAYEAEFRDAIMANILARRNVSQNVGLYSNIYGVPQDKVRAEAASLEYARKLREYRKAYASSSSIAALGDFVNAYRDFDPDSLRPKAKERIAQLQAQEARDRKARIVAERQAQAARIAAEKEAKLQAAREARMPKRQRQNESSGSGDSGPVQVDYIMVTADIMAWGNYDIALRIDNYSGSPDPQSPGYISDKSEWWHSKTIGKGYNGRIGGRYKFEVKFRNVHNVVCSGTFYPDAGKRSYKIQLHEDCTDAGSSAY